MYEPRGTHGSRRVDLLAPEKARQQELATGVLRLVCRCRHHPHGLNQNHRRGEGLVGEPFIPERVRDGGEDPVAAPVAHGGLHHRRRDPADSVHLQPELGLCGNEGTLRPREALADDTRFRRLREATPTIYLPWRQLQILPGVWTVAVRTEVELASVLPELRGATRDFDSRIDVWQARTLREHLADGPLAQPRTSALLLSGFGLAALLLAAIGLYGVMALAVRERTQELGIRNALGATAARLRWEVLRDALSTTVVGVGLGLGIALLVSRLLVGMLFQVSPLDPVTLAAVCAALLTVSVMAGYLPARQATKIEPMGALRAD